MERLINKICNTRCAGRLRGKAKHVLMSQFSGKSCSIQAYPKYKGPHHQLASSFFKLKNQFVKYERERNKSMNWHDKCRLFYIIVHFIIHIFMACGDSFIANIT